MSGLDRMQRITGRLGRMYGEMDSIVAAKVLRCRMCLSEKPSTPPEGHASYFRVGWPRCCGETMELVDGPCYAKGTVDD